MDQDYINGLGDDHEEQLRRHRDRSKNQRNHGAYFAARKGDTDYIPHLPGY